MASDHVLGWQVALRAQLDKSRHSRVNDLMLLELATALGGVDEVGNPLSETNYRGSPKQSNASQISSMIDSIQAQVTGDHPRTPFNQIVHPMTPIGALAAGSISEPMYQAGMRSFHYAGVGVQKGEMGLFDTQFAHSPNDDAMIALALPEDVRMNRDMAEALAHQLKRTRLGDLVRIVVNHPLALKYDINNPLEDYEEVERQLTQRISELSEKHSRIVFDEDSEELLSPVVWDNQSSEKEYEEAMDMRRLLIDDIRRMRRELFEARVASSSSDELFVYLTDSVITPYGDRPEPLENADLWRILWRQLREGDGSYRTIGDEDNPLHNIFKLGSVKTHTHTIDGVEIPGVVFSLPQLTPRLKSGLIGILKDLEFCNGCREPVTLAKLVNKQKGSSQPSTVEDDSWDPTQAKLEYDKSAVEAVLEEAGVRSNPPDSYADAVGLIEIDKEALRAVDFEIAELSYQKWGRRCAKCGKGWYNISTGVVRYSSVGVEPADWASSASYAKSIEKKGVPEFEGDDQFIQISAHEGSASAEYGPLGEVLVHADTTDGFKLFPGYSRPGQKSDYPLMHAHFGRIVADPIYDEYYIVVTVKDASDGRMNNYLGHLPTAQRSEFIDFNRTTCNDTRQVEWCLGIEAARQALSVNMYNANGNGSGLYNGGGSTRIHFRHYQLLADSMCRSTRVMHGRSGGASVSGVAATKGSSTIVKEDGTLIMNHSVLAQAYERQVQVLKDAAIRGSRDDLSHPLSAQIAAQPDRIGTTGGALTGPYSPEQIPTQELIETKAFLEALIKEINAMSASKVDFPWFYDPLAVTVKLQTTKIRREDGELMPNKVDELARTKERYETMLADDEFRALLEEYASTVKAYETILAEFDLD